MQTAKANAFIQRCVKKSVDPNGNGSDLQSDYFYPTNTTAPDDMSRFRQPPVGYESGDIVVRNGATLKVGGFTDARHVTIEGRLELGTSADSDAMTMTFDTAGVLNVNTGLVRVYEGDLATIWTEIMEGRNGGGWDGNGIVSDLLATHPEWGIGAYAVDDANGVDVIFGVTLLGDINMDRVIDNKDVAIFAANVGPDNPGAGMTWMHGDTDYDGDVDWSDYLAAKGNAQTVWSGGGTEIPEPATLVLLTAGAAGILLRRRRRRR